VIDLEGPHRALSLGGIRTENWQLCVLCDVWADVLLDVHEVSKW